MSVRDVASEALPGLLELSVEARCGRPALSHLGSTLTYAELEVKSNRVAHLLAELGVARGDRVGLHMEKSLDAVASLYGVLKAGATYVPLDPLSPPQRVTQIAHDAGLSVLLTEANQRARWPKLGQAGAALRALVVLSGSEQDLSGSVPAGCALVDSQAVDSQPDNRPSGPAPHAEDIACILYTSGSTGVPKGVALTHANVLAFVEWSAREFGLSSEDRLSNHAPLQFDLSVFDLFAAARVGASTILIPRQTTIFPAELVDLIEREKVTVWYSVPSALTMMVRRGGLRPGRLPSLRTALFAGETFPPRHLRALMTALPGARFANLYGPTETNVCAWYDVQEPPAEDAEPVPIGRAVAGTELFVITEEGELAGVGEVGELYVQGPTVMRGYWGDAQRSARSLVHHPCAPRADRPAYRTGDFVWRDEAGDYHLVGRRDDQVKTRGYRVELGEIEAVLHSHPAIAECVAVALPDDVVTNRLVAVINACEDVSAEDMAHFCSQRIPPYMVPERFELRDALPRTSTGKADRRLLAEQLCAEQAESRRARRQ